MVRPRSASQKGNSREIVEYDERVQIAKAEMAARRAAQKERRAKSVPRRWDNSIHIPDGDEMRCRAAKTLSVSRAPYKPFREDWMRLEAPGPNSAIMQGRKEYSYMESMYKKELQHHVQKMNRKPWITACHSPDSHEMQMKAARGLSTGQGPYRPFRDDLLRQDPPGPNSPIVTGHPVLSYRQEVYRKELLVSLQKQQRAQGLEVTKDEEVPGPDARYECISRSFHTAPPPRRRREAWSEPKRLKSKSGDDSVSLFSQESAGSSYLQENPDIKGLIDKVNATARKRGRAPPGRETTRSPMLLEGPKSPLPLGKSELKASMRFKGSKAKSPSPDTTRSSRRSHKGGDASDGSYEYEYEYEYDDDEEGGGRASRSPKRERRDASARAPANGTTATAPGVAPSQSGPPAATTTSGTGSATPATPAAAAANASSAAPGTEARYVRSRTGQYVLASDGEGGAPGGGGAGVASAPAVATAPAPAPAPALAPTSVSAAAPASSEPPPSSGGGDDEVPDEFRNMISSDAGGTTDEWAYYKGEGAQPQAWEQAYGADLRSPPP